MTRDESVRPNEKIEELLNELLFEFREGDVGQLIVEGALEGLSLDDLIRRVEEKIDECRDLYVMSMRELFEGRGSEGLDKDESWLENLKRLKEAIERVRDDDTVS